MQCKLVTKRLRHLAQTGPRKQTDISSYLDPSRQGVSSGPGLLYAQKSKRPRSNTARFPAYQGRGKRPGEWSSGSWLRFRRLPASSATKPNTSAGLVQTTHKPGLNYASSTGEIKIQMTCATRQANELSFHSSVPLKVTHGKTSRGAPLVALTIKMTVA